MEQVTIDTEYIKLQQLLKLAGLVSQGSDVKIYLAKGKVLVNGVVASERGKKIRHGDIVKLVGASEIKVISTVREV